MTRSGVPSSEVDRWSVDPYREWGGFSRLELLPSRFWYLLETQDRITGYRAVSRVLFALLLFSFCALLLSLLDFVMRFLGRMGGRRWPVARRKVVAGYP